MLVLWLRGCAVIVVVAVITGIVGIVDRVVSVVIVASVVSVVIVNVRGTAAFRYGCYWSYRFGCCFFLMPLLPSLILSLSLLVS